MSAIRTIVRWSERNGGLLSFKKYHKSTKKQRAHTIGEYSKRWHIHIGKGFTTKPKENIAFTEKENRKNVSLWQKAKNLFNRIRGK
jgi:hypothetical protein